MVLLVLNLPNLISGIVLHDFGSDLTNISSSSIYFGVVMWHLTRISYDYCLLLLNTREGDFNEPKSVQFECMQVHIPRSFEVKKSWRVDICKLPTYNIAMKSKNLEEALHH